MRPRYRKPAIRSVRSVLDVLDSRIKLVDRFAAAPDVGSGRILDGRIGGVQGQYLVGGAVGDEFEVAIDGLCDCAFGRHGLERYTETLMSDGRR